MSQNLQTNDVIENSAVETIKSQTTTAILRTFYAKYGDSVVQNIARIVLGWEENPSALVDILNDTRTEFKKLDVLKDIPNAANDDYDLVEEKKRA